jgi:hypothetical protein
LISIPEICHFHVNFLLKLKMIVIFCNYLHLLSIKFRDWICKKKAPLQLLFQELPNIYRSLYSKPVSELYGQTYFVWLQYFGYED